MAKYTLENTTDIGRPCRVFDANGVELDYCVSCDTETGEVTQIQWDPETRDFVFNEAGDGVLRKTTLYPKPLRVEFFTPKPE